MFFIGKSYPLDLSKLYHTIGKSYPRPSVLKKSYPIGLVGYISPFAYQQSLCFFRQSRVWEWKQREILRAYRGLYMPPFLWYIITIFICILRGSTHYCAIIHSLMCMLSTTHCGISGVSLDGNSAYVYSGSFYVQLKVSKTSHLISVVLWAPRHDIAARCHGVYGTWQTQAVTHPVMNWARRCLTSVIAPTPMRQRHIH